MTDKKKSFFFANTGRTALTVVLVAVVVAFALYKFPLLLAGAKKVIAITKPFIYGAVIAYILMPCYNFLAKYTSKILSKSKVKKAEGLSKVVGVLGCVFIIFFVLFLIAGVIVPEMAKSIISIATTQSIAQNAQSFFNDILQKIGENPDLIAVVTNIYNNLYNRFTTWVEEDLLKFSEAVLVGFSGSMIGIIGFLANLVIGVIVSIYIFYDKEHFIASFKKMLYSLCSPHHANRFLEELRIGDEIFGGFIKAKLLVSLIVGIICFIVLTVLNIPFALLISVIVGITNIIPFFGPWIGAVPCALLLIFVDPVQCLEFVILALVIQILDGYIIGPKILGDSTGLSSFWVLFALLFFGGLFGFAGMLVGVPVFAVIYSFIKRSIEKSISKKGLSDVDYFSLKELDENAVSKEGTADGN